MKENIIVFGNIKSKRINNFDMNTKCSSCNVITYERGLKIKIIFKDDVKNSTIINIIRRALYIELFSARKITFRMDFFWLNNELVNKEFFLFTKNIIVQDYLGDLSAICDYIAQTPFGKLDYRIRILSNLIIGDSVPKYMEKLKYYWSAFNSFYVNESKERSDASALEYIAKNYFKTKRMDRNMRDAVISKINLESNFQEVADKAQNIIDENDIKYHIDSPYSFMLLECAYFYRNKYVHGEKMPALISCENSIEINNLKIACEVVHDFLSKQLGNILNKK